MQFLRHVHLAGELRGTLGSGSGVGAGFVGACLLESRQSIAHCGTEQDEPVCSRNAAGSAARHTLVRYTVHVGFVVDVVGVVRLDVLESDKCGVMFESLSL